jgi:hypothetical protein
MNSRSWSASLLSRRENSCLYLQAAKSGFEKYFPKDIVQQSAEQCYFMQLILRIVPALSKNAPVFLAGIRHKLGPSYAPIALKTHLMMERTERQSSFPWEERLAMRCLEHWHFRHHAYSIVSRFQ